MLLEILIHLLKCTVREKIDSLTDERTDDRTAAAGLLDQTDLDSFFTRNLLKQKSKLTCNIY